MDDGSQLDVYGIIEDPATNRLAIQFLDDSNGKCAGSYEFNAMPLVVARQS